MLGRGVAERLLRDPGVSLFSPEVLDAAREADLFVLNLECCVSDRGAPWPDPRKPFFFRAPPAAVETLGLLGVDAVTLANNHALDFGEEALLDTLEHLSSGGVRVVGAGADVDGARAPVVLEAGGFRLGVVACTDHPAEFAAGPGRPGVAFADLSAGETGWVTDAVGAVRADAVLVMPHWGPNMRQRPVPHVRAAARILVDAGAALVAGHSAHVFQGVGDRVLFDLGDFIDDYAVDPDLRNDLGLLWLVDLDASGPIRLEAVPLLLEYCRTVPAEGADLAWIRRRFEEACREFGTDVSYERRRLVVTWP